MNKEDTINVYWAPFYKLNNSLPFPVPDHNLHYKEPVNLYTELLKSKEKRSEVHSHFNCPAVTGRMKSTFVFKNNFYTSFSYDFTDINNPVVTSNEGVHASFFKHSSIVGGASVTLDLMWIFFAEEPVDIHVNPPFYHSPTNLSKQGYVPSARMDPSKWFRPYSTELQFWGNKGDVVIQEDDPLFYLEVITNKKVNLQRFKMNDTLHSIASACVQSPHIYGARLPLVDRYKRFIETKTNAIVLKEIKKELLNEQIL